jgi:hypothetical protein
MKRCRACHSRDLRATSGRSRSAALRDFFMPQADPAERVVDRREPGDDAEATLKRGLKLGERDVRGRLDQPFEIGLKRCEQREAMAAVAPRCGAACRAHPLLELDRGRRADRETPRGPADRAAVLDHAHDPRRSNEINAGMTTTSRLSQRTLPNHE